MIPNASPLLTGLNPGSYNLDADYCVRGSEGRVLCCVVLLVTLYIEEGDRPEVRRGIVEAYERYTREAGSPLIWGADPMTSEPVALATSAVGDVRHWPPEIFDRFDLQMMFTGGECVDSASPYSFVAVSRCREEGELSYVSFTLPVDWQQTQARDAFPQLVLQMAELVEATHGYAGFGVVPHVLGFDAESVGPLFDVARRLPGLDLDVPSQHVEYLYTRNRLKDVNWLTIVGKRWIDAVGGEGELRKRLGETVGWRPYSGGAVLQAGSWPFMDSRARVAYGPVARALRAIRFEDPILLTTEGGFTQTEALQWLQRFD